LWNKTASGVARINARLCGLPKWKTRLSEQREGDVELYGFVRLHAREGEENAVMEALHEVVGASREEAGCLSMHTFRSVRDPRLFYIHSRWVDEQAFQKHSGLPHTVRFLKRTEAMLDQALEATRTEMME
jgi:quinol monooxygenase YgiN